LLFVGFEAFTTFYVAKVVFIAEALGLWTFTTYWYIKSKELNESRVEKNVLEQQSNLSERQSTPSSTDTTRRGGT